MTCTPAARADACSVVFRLSRCGDGGMTGLILPACGVCSGRLFPCSAVGAPRSGAAPMPECTCSGGCGVTGETIWLACPSAVRCGMTGGNLPSVCSGLMRPKFSGSGRFGGAGGVTLPPASEMVSAALLFFSTWLLIWLSSSKSSASMETILRTCRIISVLSAPYRRRKTSNPCAARIPEPAPRVTAVPSAAVRLRMLSFRLSDSLPLETGPPVPFFPIPVSYTHLDVYKRQAIPRADHAAVYIRDGQAALQILICGREALRRAGLRAEDEFFYVHI